MVFNFNMHASFPCKKPSEAIWCRKDVGQCFGYRELSAVYEQFNQREKCYSYPNESVYNIPCNSEMISMLTNQSIAGFARFTISELEVWGVSFND
jgi:nitric oxide synthase oxygenase domain/subunit